MFMMYLHTNFICLHPKVHCPLSLSKWKSKIVFSRTWLRTLGSHPNNLSNPKRQDGLSLSMSWKPSVPQKNQTKFFLTTSSREPTSYLHLSSGQVPCSQTQHWLRRLFPEKWHLHSGWENQMPVQEATEIKLKPNNMNRENGFSQNRSHSGKNKKKHSVQ
jgi:hypothetical protein